MSNTSASAAGPPEATKTDLKEEELNRVTGGVNPAVLALSLVNPGPLGTGGGYGKVQGMPIEIEGVASTTAFRP